MNLLFQSRFADKVASGEKTQTIRPPRKDGKPVCQVGQLLSLRKWAGKAYRSKQVKLIEDTTCKATASVLLLEFGFGVLITRGHTSDLLEDDKLEQFARGDGFASAKEMFEWFEQAHTLPFTGVLIQW